MLRKTTLFLLFFVSYIPLFLILAVQNINDTLADNQGKYLSVSDVLLNNIFPLCLIVLSLISLSFYLVFTAINSKGGFRNPEKIIKIKNTGVEYLSYLATYIIPFIGLQFDTWNNIVATSFLFLIVGFIYTKTNLLYANPTLALFGYYVSLATFENEEDERIIISKGKIKRNNSYKYKELCDDIYFIKND